MPRDGQIKVGKRNTRGEELRRMNLIWSTSDKYSEIAATSIASVLENSQDADEINVYVIDMGIKLAKKAMTKIANILPKPVTFAIIRIVHVWVYPVVRNIKSSIKGLAQ